MEREEQLEKFDVEYFDVEAGWMMINLKQGDQTYEERMSHVFDPLPDLKSWLEAIVIGVEQTSFTFDNEGNDITFDARRHYGRYDEPLYRLSIFWRDHYPVEEQLKFQAIMSQKQLVSEFYNKLVKLFNSDEYNPKAWEQHIIHEKLQKKLNMNYEQVLDYSAKLNIQELIDLLKSIEADNTVWDLELDCDYEYYSEVFDELVNWRKGYDKQSFDVKREDLKRVFAANAYPYDGLSLSGFRSEIIEKYLKV